MASRAFLVSSLALKSKEIDADMPQEFLPVTNAERISKALSQQIVNNRRDNSTPKMQWFSSETSVENTQ